MRQHLKQSVLQIVMSKPEKRSMIGCLRHFPVIAIAYVGILFSTWANTPYLTAVGPSPLRFRPAFKPNTNTAPPPPPSVVVHPAATVPAVSAIVPNPPTPVVSSAPTNVQTDAVAETAGTDGVISPQMLLKFFGKSTNGNTGGVKGPLDFTPPRMEAAPSSKAEISTPPH
jgi:hypothetical protein